MSGYYFLKEDILNRWLRALSNPMLYQEAENTKVQIPAGHKDHDDVPLLECAALFSTQRFVHWVAGGGGEEQDPRIIVFDGHEARIPDDNNPQFLGAVHRVCSLLAEKLKDHGHVVYWEHRTSKSINATYVLQRFCAQLIGILRRDLQSLFGAEKVVLSGDSREDVMAMFPVLCDNLPKDRPIFFVIEGLDVLQRSTALGDLPNATRIMELLAEQTRKHTNLRLFASSFQVTSDAMHWAYRSSTIESPLTMAHHTAIEQATVGSANEAGSVALDEALRHGGLKP
jgi:hypothetical protein